MWDEGSEEGYRIVRRVESSYWRDNKTFIYCGKSELVKYFREPYHLKDITKAEMRLWKPLNILKIAS